jgi:hypothetical protein
LAGAVPFVSYQACIVRQLDPDIGMSIGKTHFVLAEHEKNSVRVCNKADRMNGRGIRKKIDHGMVEQILILDCTGNL